MQLLKTQVENQRYCMTIMQMVVVACLGVKNAPGRSAETSQKDLPETLLSRKGMVNGKGKMVIFSMSNHSENGIKSLGSKR